jgi:L,D-transpeptidase ErfK/SrfK
VGGTFVYEARTGDSIASVGSRFGIDPREVAAANGLNPRDRLASGRTLRLDNRHIVPANQDDTALVINVPQRMLFLRGSDSPAVGYPVALGRRDWPTPLGDFTVIGKEQEPTWDVPLSIQEEMRREGHPVLQKVPPGPANPLGAFWLGLSIGSVGIHGTNAPSSIFRHTTHGCIRLHPDDIALLYPRVAAGTKGRIVYQPVMLARTETGIFLEAHPDVYRRTPDSPLLPLRDIAAAEGIASEIDWGEVARVLYARAGIARPVGWAE